MRSLVLLALAALAALPLSAHDHWRDRRPAVVGESCRPATRWEARRWEDRRWNDRRDDRWERHGRQDFYRTYDRDDCDDARVILRPLPQPLAPPFVGRVELHFR